MGVSGNSARKQVHFARCSGVLSDSGNSSKRVSTVRKPRITGSGSSAVCQVSKLIAGVKRGLPGSGFG